MTSSSAPKDKFFEKVINAYLTEVMQHPQTIEMHEGVLHIRDVEGPRRTGSVVTMLKAMEQQVFKCQVRESWIRGSSDCRTIYFGRTVGL